MLQVSELLHTQPAAPWGLRTDRPLQLGEGVQVRDAMSTAWSVLSTSTITGAGARMLARLRIAARDADIDDNYEAGAYIQAMMDRMERGEVSSETKATCAVLGVRMPPPKRRRLTMFADAAAETMEVLQNGSAWPCGTKVDLPLDVRDALGIALARIEKVDDEDERAKLLKWLEENDFFVTYVQSVTRPWLPLPPPTQ